MTNELLSLVKELGLSYKENSQSYIFNCPECKRDRFYISKSKGYWICFKCADSHGYKGKTYERALSILSNKPLVSVREKVAKSVCFNFASKEDNEVKIEVSPPIIQWPLDIYPIDHKFSEKGAAYLESRGVPIDVAKLYEIRYYPEQQRVIFPLIKDAKLYGWQARTVVDHPIKMLSSIGLPRNNMFMFQDRIKASDHILLAEGPIDCLKAHLAGGNVASMGKIITLKQLEIIKKAPQKKIYFALDPDAWPETRKLIDKLFLYKELYHLNVPGKDLGELSMQEAYHVFKTARKVNPGSIYIYIR